MEKQLSYRSVSLMIFILFFCAFFKNAMGLYCYVCSSDKLPECATLSSTDELPTELCSADSGSCFTKIQNGATVRGCLSVSSAHRLRSVCDTDTDNCAVCRSNKCNGQIFPEDRLSCLHCGGESCVNQTNKIDVRYPCLNYEKHDHCYSVFSYDGRNAYRGCMSDYVEPNRRFCEQNYAQCSQCAKRACNSNKVEFEEKLSCVKCDPDENSNCNVIDSNTTAVECATTTLGYKNECYTYRNGLGTHRGCLYEADEYIFEECSNVFSESCLTCNQTDCNRTPIEITMLSFD